MGFAARARQAPPVKHDSGGVSATTHLTGFLAVSLASMCNALAILMFVFAPPATERHQPGDVVVVIAFVSLKDEGRVVDNVQPGFALTVLAIDDRRLWVESTAAGWIDAAHVIRLADAEDHFSRLIHEEPLDGNRWQARAKARMARGGYDGAIKDLDEAIYLLPSWPGYYGDRANAYLAKRNFDRALADYATAVEFAPDHPSGYCNRGVAYALNGQYESAKADYHRAHRLNPKSTEPLRNLAQLLACCPEAKWRNGKQALEYARTACELSKWRNPRGLHYLACAYAETGDYDKAVRWQKKAIEQKATAGRSNRKIMREALEHFESGRPYHRLTRFQ